MSDPTISDVTPIVDGDTFTITGLGMKPAGVAPVVTLGGILQPQNSSSDTELEIDFLLDTMFYGPQPLLVTTTDGSVGITVDVQPPAGWGFVNITTPATPAERVTTTPDLQSGWQLAWDQADLVTIDPDGAWFADESVVSFKFKPNDGVAWGDPDVGVQTLQDTSASPVLLSPVPDFVIPISRPVQINVAQYAQGWDAFELIGDLPDGLTNNDGIITGTPTEAGAFVLTARYTNDDPTPTDDAFQIVVAVLGAYPGFDLYDAFDFQ